MYNFIKKLMTRSVNYYEYTTLGDDLLEDKIANVKRNIYDLYDQYFFFKAHCKDFPVHFDILNQIAFKRTKLMSLVNQRGF